MRHKMVQIDYEKLNEFYETFVPQQEPYAEQTYFSIPSTSDNGSTSKNVPSESPEELIEEAHEMLNIFLSMEQKVNDKSINENILENEIDRLLEASLTSEIRNYVLLSVEQQKHELLKVELEKSASDSRDIQSNLLKRIKILKNDFQRSQAQSIDFELKLQHQKEKMECDVSWKAKLSTLHDENVLLKHQVESTVKERENIKLEFLKLFNSIKATRVQHQNEINEMFKDVTQKTYAYANVRAQNQDLLMRISKLKSKLKMIDKGKHMNTKFDKSETLGQLLYVTPFNKNIAIKAKNVSNTKVTSDRSKLVTSNPTPILSEKQQHNANVIARGMYKINQEDTKTKDSKANTKVSNSTGVGSSNSVRRPKSKDNKSKNNVLKNTKSSSTYVLKTTNSVCLDSNKRETKPSNVIQLILWIVDSGCSKHMTGNLQLLRNFIEKFMGTVCFGNDHFARITGYGDYVQGNLTICHVYYVEGLGHNLFSVGQLCDGDLEVAFRSNTCYVWNLEGDDLLTGSRDSNLYTISISEMAASSPVCLMSRATSTKSWLWHRRLSHLNFGTINQLTSHDLVDGLPKFKYHKNHLCSACEQGKSKKASLPPKLVPSTESKLELLHMDLCGPMRVASINGKKYILVIVDDYSRYTWVYFLRTKDEAPDMIIDFVNQVQRNLKASILTIQTDNGTEFKNEKLRAFYAKLGIVHKTSIARTPQQNGVVERRNRTLVEAARTMLIFSKAPEFLWAEAIATTCFTQNRSIVHTRHNKTPYELICGRKPNVQYFYVFVSLCYPTNDRDDLGKMKPKADIELGMNYANFNDSSEDSKSVPSTSYLDNLFGPMYEEYYVSSSQEVSDNSVANTLDNDHTSSSSSIVVD
ncbi:retrovirus-related pol polyprotein from transposon TNT 1-94 [Tanacetum coccineum]